MHFCFCWYSWDDSDRHWKQFPIPCDLKDKELFLACTSVSVGAGDKAVFWTGRWLSSEAPNCIAPDLFVSARRKNRTVIDALHRGSWKKGLDRMSNETELDPFQTLSEKVQSILLTDTPDSISWNRSADGVYLGKSAYEAQFLGTIPAPDDLAKVWSIRAEPKVRFFMWLLLLNRLWTSKRLLARGCQVLETAAHLVLICPFAKQGWQLFILRLPSSPCAPLPLPAGGNDVCLSAKRSGRLDNYPLCLASMEGAE
jgi:hypothetical protein